METFGATQTLKKEIKHCFSFLVKDAGVTALDFSISREQVLYRQKFEVSDI